MDEKSRSAGREHSRSAPGTARGQGAFRGRRLGGRRPCGGVQADGRNDRLLHLAHGGILRPNRWAAERATAVGPKERPVPAAQRPAKAEMIAFSAGRREEAGRKKRKSTTSPIMRTLMMAKCSASIGKRMGLPASSGHSAGGGGECRRSGGRPGEGLVRVPRRGWG